MRNATVFDSLGPTAVVISTQDNRPQRQNPPSEPATLFDVYRLCSPPLELLTRLQEEEAQDGLPPKIVAWLRLWERINAGEPIPELDKFDRAY